MLSVLNLFVQRLRLLPLLTSISCFLPFSLQFSPRLLSLDLLLLNNLLHLLVSIYLHKCLNRTFDQPLSCLQTLGLRLTHELDFVTRLYCALLVVLYRKTPVELCIFVNRSRLQNFVDIVQHLIEFHERVGFLRQLDRLCRLRPSHRSDSFEELSCRVARALCR